MTDKEILDFKVGEQTISEMTAITFLHWVADKIKGQPAYSAANQELVLAVSSPPLTNNLAEAEKIRLFRKLLALNIAV